MSKVLHLPRSSLALGVAVLIMSVALACGDSGNSFTLLEEDFWLNASVADVRTELDRGADVNAKYISDLTPLHYAAKGNKGPVIALLLDHGADIHAESVGGFTPLHLAAINNEEPAVVALLLDRGADIRAKDHIGYTACQLAESNIDIGTKVLRRLCR